MAQAMDTQWVGLTVALGLGLLIGLERERRKGSGPDRAPAGIRTFAGLALLGATSWIIGGTLLLGAALLAATALFAVAYFRRRDDDPGLTTETAGLLTALLGALALSAPALAAGLGVVLAVLLASRAALHRFVRGVLNEHEMNDLLVLAAATLVVLPLLPSESIGPYAAFQPRKLWTVAILMMSIGAAGHVGLRLLGPRFGLPLAGLASGFVSSSATIAAMGQRAQAQPDMLHPALAGALLSTVATVLQLAAVVAATDLDTLGALSLPLLAAGGVAVAWGGLYTAQSLRSPAQPDATPGRAFSLPGALALATLLAAVALLCAAANDWLGEGGLIAASTLAGFGDTHAPAVSTASLVASARLPADHAALPILAAFTSNTATKLALAAASGPGLYVRRLALPLLTVNGAAWLGWLLR